MATYQFTIYQFSTTEGSATLESNTDNTVGSQNIGQTFTYNGNPGTQVILTDDDLQANDGNADPQGGTPSGSNGNQIISTDLSNPVAWRGQVIQLEYKITVLVNGGPETKEFFVVRIGDNGTAGANVGLAGVEPPVPGETYTIISVTDQFSPTEVRIYTTANGATFTTVGGVNAVPWDTLACFTHGTLIDTPDGLRLIETLEPGDLVTTLNNGSQAVRWVGCRKVTRQEMIFNPALRPVLFAAGAIGNSRPLLVSPQHRMLLNDWRAQVYFGEDQVLIAAKALINGQTVRQVMPETDLTYCHLLFDQHEVILAEGALSESFHPGEIGLGGLDDAQRDEIAALFPQLALLDRRAAFPIVRLGEARGLPLAG
jgi:Hint domain